VTKDVAPYAIVGGVPARLIRYRFDEALRERMLRVRWWQYATGQLAGVPFSDPDAALTEIERRVNEEGMLPYDPVRVTRALLDPAVEEAESGVAPVDGHGATGES